MKPVGQGMSESKKSELTADDGLGRACNRVMAVEVRDYEGGGVGVYGFGNGGNRRRRCR